MAAGFVKLATWRSLTLAVLIVAFNVDFVRAASDFEAVDVHLAHGGRLVGVQGRAGLVERSGRDNYRRFSGVPYAEPPIGARRFMSPEKKAPWSGTRPADSTGYRCPGRTQSTTPSKEDCLTLDVYIPVNMTSSSSLTTATPNSSLPTVVFMVGDDSAVESNVDGSALSVFAGIIVVVVRHRVDVLGYLGTGSHHSPGNLGILDQRLGLEWVQENIALFGGDPDRVTLAGGRRSYVSLHLYATPPDGEANRLFHQLIASDGVTSPRFIKRKPPITATYSLATQLGCANISSSDLVDCLRNMTVEDILNATTAIDGELGQLSWEPYLDGDLLTPDISQISANVDAMLGFSTRDGAIKLPPDSASFSPGNGTSGTHSDWSFLWKLSDPYVPNVAPELANSRLLMALAKGHYTDWSAPGVSDDAAPLTPSVVHSIEGDLSVVVPTFDFIDDLPMNTFLFVFDESANATFWSYFFGLPVAESKLQNGTYNEQRQLSLAVMEYASQFAEYGNPNANDENATKTLTVWPRYDSVDRPHAVFSARNVSRGQGYRADSVAFWTVTVPEVGSFLDDLIASLTDSATDLNTIYTSLSTQSTTIQLKTVATTLDELDMTEYVTTTDELCSLTCKETSDCQVDFGQDLFRWSLTLGQANLLVQVLIILAVVFACLAVVLVIILIKTRSALSESRADSMRNKRGAATKKSIRGSGSRWLWKQRDPDDDLADSGLTFENTGIKLDLDESTSMEKLDIKLDDI